MVDKTPERKQKAKLIQGLALGLTFGSVFGGLILGGILLLALCTHGV